MSEKSNSDAGLKYDMKGLPKTNINLTRTTIEKKKEKEINKRYKNKPRQADYFKIKNKKHQQIAKLFGKPK